MIERKSAENRSNNRQLLLSHPNQHRQPTRHRLRVTTAEEEVISPKRDDRHIRDQI